MYRMPMNRNEVIAFKKDPTEWMKSQIDINLPKDVLAQAVFKLASQHKIKTRKKEFYVMLAFVALMNNAMVTADFQKYRQATPPRLDFEQTMPG